MAVKHKYGKIGVLMGGPSTEREISLKSGKSVFESLEGVGINVTRIDINTDNIEENINLISSKKIDCAFLALHGRFGEDGTIQEILEYIDIPYTCSGVLASRLAMDKIASRRILEVYGLAVPKYNIMEKSLYKAGDKLKSSFVFPLVVKPAAHGSSIGLSIVDKENQLKHAINSAFNYDETIVIEEFIPGRELTVGILDNKPLPVIEILPKKRLFDYEAKYHAGMTEYLAPADLEPALTKKVQAQAIKAHGFLGCFGCSRVDIILAKDNTPFILEVNSIPGLTSTSLLPRAAYVAGIEFSQLCLKLIELAYEKAKNKFKV